MGTRAPRGTDLRPTAAPLVSHVGARRRPSRWGWVVVLALALSVGLWVALPGGALAPALRGQASAALPPALTLRPAPDGLGTVSRGAVRAVFPFAPPHGLRPPRAADDLPSLYADGVACSIGCRVPAAIDGWPLRPFHGQHPLRAGINELRSDSLHVGVDIQATDGAPVYAVEPGVAVVLARSGPDARVQVGSFIYWHIVPVVRTGQLVRAYATELGTVMRPYGHLAFSEVDAAGRYVNPLRPGGRVLAPWVDHAAPVIAHPSVAADGSAVVAAFDPQTFVRRTTYDTPVLAPAALAYRLYDLGGRPLTSLRFAFRGTHLLPWRQRREIYVPGARAPGFSCFATQTLCRPRWTFWLAGGLAALLPGGVAPGRYRLTVYAWDWADNRRAIDTVIRMTSAGWRPRGHVPPRPLPMLPPAFPRGPRLWLGPSFGLAAGAATLPRAVPPPASALAGVPPGVGRP